MRAIFERAKPQAMELMKHYSVWRKFYFQLLSLFENMGLDFLNESIVYFKWIFQKHNFVSLAAQTYGKRECQSRPPYSFSDATKLGISDFKWLTLSVTFGRPMLATMFSLFGKYFTVKPPSSCIDLLSAGRLSKRKRDKFTLIFFWSGNVWTWKHYVLTMGNVNRTQSFLRPTMRWPSNDFSRTNRHSSAVLWPSQWTMWFVCE